MNAKQSAAIAEAMASYDPFLYVYDGESLDSETLRTFRYTPRPDFIVQTHAGPNVRVTVSL